MQPTAIDGVEWSVCWLVCRSVCHSSEWEFGCDHVLDGGFRDLHGKGQF